jgi:hypothetical protein
MVAELCPSKFITAVLSHIGHPVPGWLWGVSFPAESVRGVVLTFVDLGPIMYCHIMKAGAGNYDLHCTRGVMVKVPPARIRTPPTLFVDTYRAFNQASRLAVPTVEAALLWCDGCVIRTVQVLLLGVADNKTI